MVMKLDNKNFQLVALGLFLLILEFTPPPWGIPLPSWHFFVLFLVMVIAMILEPIPATVISLIAVIIGICAGKWMFYQDFAAGMPNEILWNDLLKWGLGGFASPTVWLVFAAFIFALGYEVSGLGRRVALIMVRFMGRRTLTLGYAIVLSDVLLAPFTPSNTARTGGTIFPVIRNLPPLFSSLPNDPSSRKIGGYLMWMMVIGTSISSSMFITASAPNILGVELAYKIVGVTISWSQWFLAFAPTGIILLIVSPLLSYYLYKPQISKNDEVVKWAQDELQQLGRISANEIKLIGLVLLSLSLWVFGASLINSTVVALLAVALMIAIGVVKWSEITAYKTAWNTLVNLATLVVMANGLTKSGFIDWFDSLVSSHLHGMSPLIALIVLVLIFYFSHYLFASLSAHTATVLPVILSIGKSIGGVPLDKLSLLLVLSIGIMGVLTPYATGPGVIIYGCGYISSRDYWRLGCINGVLYISVLLLITLPLLYL
jgi:citrate:succinate antiporter